MTDPITCPECDGRKEQRIGALRLRCPFCHGRGQVGGDFEPAEGGHVRSDEFRQPVEGETYDPEIHGPLPAVGAHPAVLATGRCGQCLGFGTVVVGPQMASQPCPSCNPG